MIRRNSRLTASTVVLAVFTAGMAAKMAHVHPHVHSGSCGPGIACPIEHTHSHEHALGHDEQHHHGHPHAANDRKDSSEKQTPNAPCGDDCAACLFLTLASEEAPPAADLETQYTSQPAPVLSVAGRFETVSRSHLSRGPPSTD